MGNTTIILFDIDYTLFDVGYFDINFSKLLSPILSLPEESLRKKSTEIIIATISQEGFLDIEKYLSAFLREIGKEADKAKVEEVLFGGSFFKDGFYKEVEETLRHLQGKVRIGIFSQGDESFQSAKITQSGLKDFFENELVYIKKNKLDFLPLLQEKHGNDRMYLVDDKPGVLHTVKEHMPGVFTIWIKRGRHANQAQSIKDFAPDKIITHLSEIIPLIK